MGSSLSRHTSEKSEKAYLKLMGFLQAHSSSIMFIGRLDVYEIQ